MLDAAATSASRVGSTNYKPTGTARETYIRNYIARQALGLLDPAQLQVTPTAYASFSAIGQPDAGSSGYFGEHGPAEFARASRTERVGQYSNSVDVAGT